MFNFLISFNESANFEGFLVWGIQNLSTFITMTSEHVTMTSEHVYDVVVVGAGISGKIISRTKVQGRC